MERKLTCIICPIGCELTVATDEGECLHVVGNGCPRGKQYAQNECVNPRRTVTSTMLCDNGEPVAVKTERMIPKEKIGECMRMINSAVAKTPICVGDVLLEDVCGSNIVATQNKG